MVAGVRNGWFGDSVQLRLTRGSLTLEYRDGESIFMTGPGEFVFEGSAAMTDQDVIDYLSQNPDFFNRNPGLIDQIQVPSEQGVISLSHHAMAQYVPSYKSARRK